MNSEHATSLFRRYGPIVFSHFFRGWGDEAKAVRATQRALLELLRFGSREPREVVVWVRSLPLADFE